MCVCLGKERFAIWKNDRRKICASFGISIANTGNSNKAKTHLAVLCMHGVWTAFQIDFGTMHFLF